MSAIFDFALPPPAQDATPYEGHRRRLVLMERLQAARHGLPIERARELVARDVKLTTAQIVNIRKRKRKDLYGDLRDRIDATFVALAHRVIRDLSLEMAALDADPRGPDPSALAEAKASRDALIELIEEARDVAGRRRALRRAAEAQLAAAERHSGEVRS